MKINGLSEVQKSKLSARMQEFQNSGVVSGAALCIIQDGKELFRENYGFADKEAKHPIKNDTIYRLFSMTKPIISVAAHMLIERGLLNYDDPVSKYIPTFKAQKVMTIDGVPVFEAGASADSVNDAVSATAGSTSSGRIAYRPASREATVKDLLNMTAGLYYPDGTVIGQVYGALQDKINAAFDAGHPYSTYEIACMLGEQPLGFDPGAHWNYSTCADVLGAVIEVAAGKRLGTFLEDEIFKPLGMVDTGFMVPSGKYERYAKMYDRRWPDPSDIFESEVYIFCVNNRKLPNPFESGGAGLVTTLDDYGRFAMMLANGGSLDGVQLLSPDTFKLMTTASLGAKQKADLTWDSLTGYTYSNLFRMLEDPEKNGYSGSTTEFGWDGWTGNYYYADRENRLVFLFFIQVCGGTDPTLMRELSKIIYDA